MKEIRSQVDRGELKTRSARWLGFGGLIPFWSLPFIQFAEPAMGEDWVLAFERWIVLYGAIIVSFMGGGRWAFRVFDVDDRPSAVFGGFLGAVTPALIAWVIAGLPEIIGGYAFAMLPRLFLIALLLLVQLAQDWVHYRRGGVPPWYFDLRLMLVTGATTPILAAILLAPLF